MSTRKATLRSIKTGAFLRGLAMAKVSVAAGAKAASHVMGNWFSSKDQKQERLKNLVISQVKILTEELGQLKGSLMKAGQMLSVLGEQFLSPEANAFLKSLQSRSPPLEWKAIEKVLQKELGAEKLTLLDIEKEPCASASLGQVHRAKRKQDGKLLALKIQYPGVDKAIESDIKVLRSVLVMANFIQQSLRLDALLKEVQGMLKQEVDYVFELEQTRAFRSLLADDPRYVVPEVYPEFSTRRVLATSYEDGFPVDSDEIKTLSQERRNAIGQTAAELFWRELFCFHKVQTDPHFGNYRIRLKHGGLPDQLVLFDFGAVREFPKKFTDPYFEMVRGTVYQDMNRLNRGATALGFLQEGDSEELRSVFHEVCFLFTEPFRSEAVYDWGVSDLPKRIAKKGGEMILKFKLRSPPREIVFLDRKMAGIFVFLSTLKVQAQFRETFRMYLGS